MRCCSSNEHAVNIIMEPRVITTLQRFNEDEMMRCASFRYLDDRAC